MNKEFVCDVKDEEAKKFIDIFEMKNTLESLALQIANNNSILKEDSLLYKRLIEDYKENLSEFNKFWFQYYEKYGYRLKENNQFSLDFKTNKIYIVPIEKSDI